MDYTRESIAALVRGPLTSTPQGLVVIASAVTYAAFAFAFVVLGFTPPLGKSIGSAVVVCASWPFIVFLQFVAQGLPSFAPSLGQAAFIALCAAAPALYVAWYTYA
jgi:hypothetical protein